MHDEEPILKVSNLVVTPNSDDSVKLVNNVSFEVKAGERLAIVGESGSGKSLTCFTVMGLLDPSLSVAGGEIEWQGKNMLAMTNTQRRNLLNTDLSMVYQEPLTALNPLMRIGKQVREGVPGVTEKDVLRILEEVGLSDSERVSKAMPHELSGGMRQRAMIAMAMIKQPKLLIADEPTTALDVTFEYQVLKLMYELTEEMNTSLLFVTHDLGVVARLADRVLVMYLGEIVEEGETTEILNNPQHPYTKKLLMASSLVNARNLVLEEES